MEEKTIIVTGIDRGGTSVIAGILHILGVPMGRIENGSYEDVDVNDYLRNKEGVKIKNLEHKVWGFKLPNMYDLDFSIFRNPYVFLAFRDPIAVVKFNHNPGDEFFIPEVNRVNEIQQKFIPLLSMKNTRPISFEKLCNYREDTVKEIAAFVGLTVSEEQMQTCMEFINPQRGYYGKRPA